MAQRARCRQRIGHIADESRAEAASFANRVLDRGRDFIGVLGSVVLQLDDRAKPAAEVVGFANTPAQPRQLEMGMSIDEPRQYGDLA